MADVESLVLFRRVPAGLGRAALEMFAEKLRKRVTRRRHFSCLITDDSELRRLNRQFLGKDYATDVLSFPNTPNRDKKAPLGELAISAGRAAEQAAEFGHSTEEEIQILMLHGVLHLMGMDHEIDGGGMARAELAWRKRLGLSTGLIERVSA